MHARSARSFFRFAALAAALPLASCASSTATDGHAGDESHGRLVAIADGDLVSSAFHDGKLFSGVESRENDTLTIIGLPLPAPETNTLAHVAQADITNSVLGPPRCLAVTPDGMSALILATRGDAGSPPYTDKTIGDLSRSGMLTLVDISGAPETAPTVVASMEMGDGARSLSVHPDGDLAVVVRSSNNTHELIFVRIDQRHGMWKLAQIPLSELPASESVGPATVAFSPEGNSLAVTALGLDQVVFYELIREGGVIGIKRWGEPVSVPNFPFTASYTPDGKFFIVASDMWGDNARHDLDTAPSGSVTAICVGDPASSAHSAHEIASTVSVGMSPEGLAVSPDGRRIVTGNMRLSHLPASDPRHTAGGTLSLLSLDTNSGALTAHGEFDCPAGPQGLAFDAQGHTLFVADFDNGVVQEWAMSGSTKQPTLEYTRLRVGVARGVHGLAVAP